MGGCRKCCNVIMLSPQPPQFKLDPRLARLLGIHTQTRSCIIQALWQYVKTNKLQDSHDKEYINCDKYFQQVWTPAVAENMISPGQDEQYVYKLHQSRSLILQF